MRDLLKLPDCYPCEITALRVCQTMIYIGDKKLYFVIVTRRMSHKSSHRYVVLLSVDKYKIRPLIITQFSATSYRINEVSCKH